MDGTCTLTRAFFRVLGKDCECQNTVFLVTTKKDVLKFEYCVMILCLMIIFGMFSQTSFQLLLQALYCF